MKPSFGEIPKPSWGALKQVASGRTTPSTGDAEPGKSEANPERPPDQTCPHCEAAMAESQDWCTQCGERAPWSLRRRASWASAGALTAASALLASGAAAAGVAALTNAPVKEPHPSYLAQQPPAATTPVTPATPVSPGSPETLKVPHSGTSGGLTSAYTTSTLSSSAYGITTTHSSSSSSTTSTTTSTTASQGAGPTRIVLEGEPAKMYNPDGYPKTALSEPASGNARWRLEPGEPWSAEVLAGKAQHMNVGLLIDLEGQRSVGTVKVKTSKPDFPFAVYGTDGKPPKTGPSSGSGSGWTLLHKTRTPSNGSVTLTLGESGKKWHYVLFWVANVSKVSPSLVGKTLEIKEVKLFE